VEGRVNYEVPNSVGLLVPVRVDFVRVLDLVRDQLVQLTAFELHLLFVELVFDDVRASLLEQSPRVLLFIFLLDNRRRRDILEKGAALMSSHVACRHKVLVIHKIVGPIWVVPLEPVVVGGRQETRLDDGRLRRSIATLLALAVLVLLIHIHSPIKYI